MLMTNSNMTRQDFRTSDIKRNHLCIAKETLISPVNFLLHKTDYELVRAFEEPSSKYLNDIVSQMKR